MSQSLLKLSSLPRDAGECLHWGELPGAGTGLALAEISALHPGPVLAIVARPHEIECLKREWEFFSGRESGAVLEFPDRQTLPYDRLSPPAELRAARLRLLNMLPGLRTGVVLCSVAALMHRLAPRQWLFSHSLQLQTGQQLDARELQLYLQNGGYRRVETVTRHGEYAVRGALLDIFPAGLEMPLRIEFLDDTIESLRFFAAETQRTVARVKECKLLPAREYPLDQEGVQGFRKRWSERMRIAGQRCPVYRQLSNRIPADGAEYYLPLFFAQTETLFCYLPATTLVLCVGPVQRAASDFRRLAEERYRSRGADLAHPVLRSADLFLDETEFQEQLERFPHIVLHAERIETKDTAGGRNFGVQEPGPWSLESLRRSPNPANGERRLLCASHASQCQAMQNALTGSGESWQECAGWREFLDSGLQTALGLAPLERGLRLQRPALGLFAAASQVPLESTRDTQLPQPASTGAAAGRESTGFGELGQLEDGAAVVHEEHGVGRYRGFVRLETGGVEEEFLSLEYADEARLYVPVDTLQLVHPYIGGDPPLHSLDKKKWRRQKRRAARQAQDVAAELLALQARRSLATGVRCTIPEPEYAGFVAGFPFIETPDQAAAIASVLQDMQSGQPMDRLICGEVGCGKTEIAMRAALVAAGNGMQSIVLTPTTLLCEQHLATFSERFAELPVRIAGLSRLNTARTTHTVKAAARAGNVDILVTTHRLLHREMLCPNPGLLVLDEEHRFGVRDKEKLKELRGGMHVLSLSATPIPRTLNMALGGLRDISIIAQAPEGRLPVKTFVASWSRELVSEALQRELQRAGQVYYLHNNVATVSECMQRVQALCPGGRVGCTHGRMKRAELDQIMQHFRQRDFDILVCTTIVESGLDIPNANTIVVEDAKNFGLAQLHQLRGRVGRSQRQAYAYLLAPEHETRANQKALRRLEVIAATAESGAGFQLAVHDLELRGGGEILGREQSGRLHDVGITLYSELLQRAKRKLQGDETPADTLPVEIELQLPALLPQTYVPDVGVRLVLYRRLGALQGVEELSALRLECQDRFGSLPPAAENLFRRAELQLQARELGIEKITVDRRGMTLIFAAGREVPAQRIAELLQQDDGQWKFSAPQSLRLAEEIPAEQRLEFVRGVLRWLRDEDREPRPVS